MTRLRLGDTEVSRIGLGTNRLSKTPEHVDFIRDAVAAGVQLVDTAHTYAGEQSEDTIGTALGPNPDGCVVATKGGWNGARPEVLRVEIAVSLRRLRTETIGLYYLHRPDPETPLEESLGAIKEHQEAGQIRNVGVSNVGIAQIERARDVATIAAVQNPYKRLRPQERRRRRLLHAGGDRVRTLLPAARQRRRCARGDRGAAQKPGKRGISSSATPSSTPCCSDPRVHASG
jgi:aryl-alcohol dehydrogenase-like predicted oxidoreductase